MLQTIIRPYSTDKGLPNDVRSTPFTEYDASGLLLFDNKPNEPDERYSVTRVLLLCFCIEHYMGSEDSAL